MNIITSSLLRQFPEIIFGMSTKIHSNGSAPYYFNLSYSVGDRKAAVTRRRRLFYKRLGLPESRIAFQKQVHGDRVRYVTNGGLTGESDAQITDKPGIGLTVSTGDCQPIFIYDFKNRVIAGIHSGWRSSRMRILQKTLNIMANNFGAEPENIAVYIAPSISGKNYEVGEEVAGAFPGQYILRFNGSFYLNLPAMSYDTLRTFGIPDKQIQISDLCTWDLTHLLQSYRRGGAESGRAIGIIAMKPLMEKE